MSFWPRRRDPFNLHPRLEARRSEPRPEFVQQLADELREHRRTARRPLRLALAAGLTALMLVAAGAFGGGATAASLERPVTAVIDTVQFVLQGKTNAPQPDESVVVASGGSADDQYEEERRRCREAAYQAHQDFHDQLEREHAQFHQTAHTRAQHSAFHAGQTAAHRAYHETVLAPALEACERIGR